MVKIGQINFHIVAGRQNATSRLAGERRENKVFATARIAGRVGGVVARTLLATGKEGRLVVRSAENGTVWRE